MAYGAPFPLIYDWTWGEAIDYVAAHIQREKEQLRTRALMDMTHAATLARMLTGQAGKTSVMDTYNFLWTKEERNQAKLERLRAKMEAEASKSQQKKGGECK